ncbi:MAG: glycosyltransferase WbuB [Proteobacteria bacterium]|nr:glycosyltransferase WbuB [Pseudomonadota bacterium]
MKILLLNQTFYPDNLATSQQVADLAVFLTQRGHQVSVVTGQRAYEERQIKFSPYEKWQGIEIYRVASTGFGKKRLRYRIVDSATFFISLVWKLMFFPEQDLVISFTSPPLIGALGALFTWLKGGRSVQWLMDINPDAAFQVGYLNRKSLLGRVLNFIFEATLKNASEVIVLDRWMKHRVIEHGAPKERVIIVPPWSVFKENELDVEKAIEEFKREHHLENKFIVLYSGNHSVVHPLDTLLEAAKALRNQQEVVFLFIGAGLRTKDVAEFKEKNQLSNIIQLPLQPREKVKASFGSADLHCVVMGPGMSGLVHTSKIYSVLASGKPFVFVGPNQSHVSDLVRVNSLGAVVESGQAGLLAATILETQKLSLEAKEHIRNVSHSIVRNYAPAINLSCFYQNVIQEGLPNEAETYPLSSEPVTDEG